jgi:hypothetical protein
MDEFLPIRYTNDVDIDTGKQNVAWENTFASIKDIWESVIRQTIDIDQQYKVEQQKPKIVKMFEDGTNSPSQPLVDILMREVKSALLREDSNKDVVKWIPNLTTSSHFTKLNHTNHINYNESKMGSQYEIGMNKMISTISGVDKLLSW